ncbi:MAG: hypothetical protein JKX85_02815, partial [Phycisphaeraceae bacterium]|nr:hypothetical protein [Phycisphaeraceae bacterium]
TGKVCFEKKQTANMPVGGAKLLCEYPIEKLTATRDATFLMLTLEIEGKQFHNKHFFTPYKDCELPEAVIQTSVKAQGENFAVTICTSTPAFYVSLNADGIRGEFTDNCITLVPSEPRTLVFSPKQNVTLGAFKKALTVKHLRTTYR